MNLDITIHTPEGMIQLGKDLAKVVTKGQCIALYGQIGAGKSLLCRSIIQAIIGEHEDVPSPTFTLVQTYDAPDFEIWHSDLYRLTRLNQVDELGLWDAFDTSLCLLEWPEVLGNELPKDALKIVIIPNSDTDHRDITITTPTTKWTTLNEVLRDTYL